MRHLATLAVGLACWACGVQQIRQGAGSVGGDAGDPGDTEGDPLPEAEDDTTSDSAGGDASDSDTDEAPLVDDQSGASSDDDTEDAASGDEADDDSGAGDDAPISNNDGDSQGDTEHTDDAADDGEPGICGNGVPEGNETCDAGGEAASCNEDCSEPICGDGVLNEPFGEACDDNNSVDGDGCPSDCLTSEPFWTCSGEPSVCERCGNAIAEGTEDCDTGGESGSCNTDCSSPNCGDGVINEPFGEACDDNNSASGDGCPNDCLAIESSWTCSGEPSLCERCGNNVVEGTEACDGGFVANGTCNQCALACDAGYGPCADPADGCVCAEVQLEWLQQNGGAYNTYAHAVAVAPDGSVFHVGSLRGYAQSPASIGGASIVSAGDTGRFDAFIVKYTAEGNVAWVRQGGSHLVDTATAVAVVPEASGFGAVVVGSFGETNMGSSGDSNATFAPYSVERNGNRQAFVVRYGANGDVRWLRGAGSNRRDEASAVAVLPDGSIVVGGYYCDYFSSCNGATFGDHNLTGHGQMDAFVARYDENGTALWAKSLWSDSNASDRMFSLAYVPASNPPAILVAGQTDGASFGDGNVTLAAAGAFAAQLDINGTVAWLRLIARPISNAYAYATGVAPLTNGALALSGDFRGNVCFGVNPDANCATGVNRTSLNPTSQSPHDAYVMRLGSDGTMAWVRFATGAGNDDLWSVAAGPNNSVVATGTFFEQVSLGDWNVSAAGNDDLMLARYDENGTLRWAYALGASASDEGDEPSVGISALQDGTLVLTGTGERPAGADKTIYFDGDSTGQSVAYPWSTFVVRLKDHVP